MDSHKTSAAHSALSADLQPLDVVFAYRSRILGGAETLFVRMANELARRGFRVGVLDFADGYLASNVDARVTRLTALGNGLDVTDQTVVLAPLSSVEFFREALKNSKANPIVLLWSLHPDNVNAWLPRFRYGQALWTELRAQSLLHPIGLRSLRRLLEAVHAQNGLIFMDGPNLRAVESLLGLSLDRPLYCPVPGPLVQELSPQAPENVLKIAWVSRLAIDKVQALLRFIADLEALDECGLPVTLTIIGDGDQRPAIEQCLENSSLDFEFLGSVAHMKLQDELRTHHVFAGMGTALLEAAACGLPCVVVDPHTEPIGPGRPYRMFHDSEAFALGEVITPRIASPSGAALNILLRSLCDPIQWQEQSFCSIRRAQQQSVENSADLLVQYIRGTQATLRTLRPVLRSYRVWLLAKPVARSAKSKLKNVQQ